MLEPTLVKNNICRCCLTQGCYKDISSEYFFCGRKEVYEELLRETFNITITFQTEPGSSGHSRYICESCINQLRDAAQFKLKVLLSEERINHLYIGTFGKDVDLKNKASSEISLNGSDVADDEEIEEIPKTIPIDDAVVIKQEDDDSQNMFPEMKDVDDLIVKEEPTTLNHETLRRKRKQRDNNQYAVPKTNRSPEEKDLSFRDNTIKLVINSNICLFKSLHGYIQCYYCSDKFRTFALLREHNTKHIDMEKRKMLRRIRLHQKAEISDLSCNLCSEKFDGIDQFKTHLTVTHGISFSNENNFLIPFKVLDSYICVLCKKRFNTFRCLHKHMNSHYFIHMCETCGCTFINNSSLRLHVLSHTGFKCTHCSMSFVRNSERMRHEAKEHDKHRKRRRYCRLCDVVFEYTYQLDNHRVNVHGKTKETVVCEQCKRVFPSPNSLKVHTRSVHLKERNFQCCQCDCRFFTKYDLKRHEKTHNDTDRETFSCELCDTKFKSKDSQRKHLRRQHLVVNSKKKKDE